MQRCTSSHAAVAKAPCVGFVIYSDFVQGAVKGNAATLRDIIIAQYEQFGKTVVLLGHSKGGTDAAAACAMYWPELNDKVRGLILLQSPYGGTPLAADLLSGGEFGALNSVFLGKLASFANPDVSALITLYVLYTNLNSLHCSIFKE